MSESIERGRSPTVSLARFMNRWLMPLLPWIPVPHRFLHGVLLADNKKENEADCWGRLRNPSELGRYSVIHGFVQEFARDGSVLDVGCSEGLLQERIAYGQYLGIDVFPQAIARAGLKANERTRFMHADAASFAPDELFDAIIWNECLYYLRDPIGVIQRYRQYLRPRGVMIVSMFYQTFATRRLFRQLKVLGPVLAEVQLVASNKAWVLRAYDASLGVGAAPYVSA
jgi:SAM-dependent methyltransferase